MDGLPGVPALGRRELDADALVDPALRFVAGHPDRPDLAGVRDVGPAVGLEVEPDDLDRPDLLDPGREQVDLRADEVRDRERLVAGQDVDADLALGPELLVDVRLDLAHQLARHPFELEVHPAGAGLHVAAGDLRAVVAPDDAAQDMERGVGAHEKVAPRPLDLGPDRVADARRRGSRLEVVDDLAVGLARADDGPARAIADPGEATDVGRLAAAAGIEDGAVEEHAQAIGGVDAGLDRPRVGVRIGKLGASWHRQRVPRSGAPSHRDKRQVSGDQYFGPTGNGRRGALMTGSVDRARGERRGWSHRDP